MVRVMPKKAVLDPQGAAVREALHHLGGEELAGVKGVRVGKLVELTWDAENPPDERRLHELCRDFLSNPVIEDYELEVVVS